MPEGDAVWRTARRLHEALAGEVLTDWDLRWARWATTDLRGATTLEVRARGKHLLHRLDSGHTLHTHLRMEGSWRVQPKATTRAASLHRRDLRALLGTADTWAFGLRLGMVDVVRTVDEARLVGHLGPDPLGEGWDAAAVVANLRAKPDDTIGSALLDQRVLAGVGTMWATETLFLERVSPWAAVGDLADDQLTGVADRAAALLRSAIEPPRGVRRPGDGRRSSRSRPALRLYDLARRPCPRCRTPIRTGRVGAPPQDRQLFFCPTCQPTP